MLGDKAVREAAKNYVVVVQDYDGLNGKVIKWTFEHGNTNHDPSVLAWILDPEGGEIARAGGKLGSASAFAAWLKQHSRASFPLVDPAAFEILKNEARQIAARRKLGAVLASLRDKALEETGKAREEAGDLLAKLEDYAAFQVKRAKGLMERDPAGALAALKAVAAQFKGDKVGADADAAYKTLKKDKAFQREVKAGLVLAKMRELKRKIKPKRPLTSPSNRKVVNQLRGLMRVLEKSFKDTRMCARARELMKALGK